MILTIWIILFVISITFIILGYVFNTTNSDVLLVVGWGFIFLLGCVMLFGSLTHKTAETEIINYTYTNYNYSIEGSNYTEAVISSQTIIKNNTYEEIPAEAGILNTVVNLHTIGFFIMITGLLGSVLFWFDNKNRGDIDE